MTVIVVVTVIMVMIVIVSMIVSMIVPLMSFKIFKTDRLLTRLELAINRITELLDSCLKDVFRCLGSIILDGNGLVFE